MTQIILMSSQQLLKERNITLLFNLEFLGVKERKLNI